MIVAILFFLKAHHFIFLQRICKSFKKPIPDNICLSFLSNSSSNFKFETNTKPLLKTY